jgi:uncharacterized protein YukE
VGQFSGADPDQLDQLGGVMGGAADRLDAIRQQISARLAMSPWEGTDAAEFRDEWDQHLQGVLNMAASTARDGANTVCRNADQQRQASGISAGGASGPGGSGGDHPTLFSTALSLTGYGLGALGVRDAIRSLGDQDVRKLIGLARYKFGYQDIAAGFGELKSVTGEALADVKKADLTKFLKAGTLADVAQGLDKIAPVIGGAIDVGTMIGAYSDPHADGQEKAHSTVDVALDGLELATAGIPPVAIGLAVGHVAMDVVWDSCTEQGRAQLAADGKAVAGVAAAVGKGIFTADKWEVETAAHGVEAVAHGVGGLLGSMFGKGN